MHPSDRRLRLKRALVAAAPLVLGAALCIHFAATALYLTPANPIKLRIGRLADAYMEPYFSQRWELFAPDPIVDTRLLIVSCRVDIGDGVTRDLPWVDVTTPLRALKYRYRFSPADRVDRAQHVALYLVFPRPDKLAERMRNVDDNSPEHRALVARLDAQRARSTTIGERLLARVASAECDRVNGVGRTRAVRVRMIAIETPPFSKRELAIDSGRRAQHDFDWRPYEAVSSL